MKQTCAASRCKHLAPQPPRPVCLIPQLRHQPAPWTHSSRNFEQQRHRQKTHAIAEGVLASRIVTKSVLLLVKRFRRPEKTSKTKIPSHPQQLEAPRMPLVTAASRREKTLLIEPHRCCKVFEAKAMGTGPPEMTAYVFVEGVKVLTMNEHAAEPDGVLRERVPRVILKARSLRNLEPRRNCQSLSMTQARPVARTMERRGRQYPRPSLFRPPLLLRRLWLPKVHNNDGVRIRQYSIALNHITASRMGGEHSEGFEQYPLRL